MLQDWMPGRMGIRTKDNFHISRSRSLEDAGTKNHQGTREKSRLWRE